MGAITLNRMVRGVRKRGHSSGDFKRVPCLCSLLTFGGEHRRQRKQPGQRLEEGVYPEDSRSSEDCGTGAGAAGTELEIRLKK